jgi:heptosyltransferase III
VNSFRGKILVIRGGAIGDFILTLPAIAALRRHFPEAFLEVLGYPHIARLALAGGLVNRVQSIEARALAGFFARHGELAEDLVDYFSEFDLIVSYLYDPDRIFETNVARCTRAQFITGPPRPGRSDQEHAARLFLKPLERLAIFDADFVPRLRLPKQIAPLNQLALHPGSGSEDKNWPETNWAELLQHLIDGTRFNLLMIGGEAEIGRLQRLAAALPPSRVRVAQNLPLPEVAGLLAECAGFIGHDSGISHLAAAVGLPAILLWGRTDQQIWRPPGDRITVLSDPAGLSNLSVERVITALSDLPESVVAPVA